MLARVAEKSAMTASGADPLGKMIKAAGFKGKEKCALGFKAQVEPVQGFEPQSVDISAALPLSYTGVLTM